MEPTLKDTHTAIKIPAHLKEVTISDVFFSGSDYCTIRICRTKYAELYAWVCLHIITECVYIVKELTVEI